MKLVVADIKDSPLFEKADFGDMPGVIDLSLLRLPNVEPLDGSIFRSLPKDTTHLIARFADRLGEAELAHLTQLKYLGLAYTGWWDKYFDAAALRERGVVVTINPSYAPPAVAEAVFATAFSIYRRLTDLHLGELNQETPIGRELAGRTLGILGLGNIGVKVAQIGMALGMRVITTSNHLLAGVTHCDKETLLKESDLLGIFVPKSLGPVLTAEDFRVLKPDATISNPSGHENIETPALANFLSANPAANYIYLAMPEVSYFETFKSFSNAWLFPLFSSKTVESLARRKAGTLKNLRDFLTDGQAPNRVL